MNGVDLQKVKKLVGFTKTINFFKQRSFQQLALSFTFLLTSLSLAAQDPTLTGIEGSPLSYDEEQAATAITASITVQDPDSPLLTSATVNISGNLANTEDVLEFVDAFSITGSFDALTGTLTLTGPASPPDFTNALRSVLYKNTNDANPSTLLRTISFSVNDGRPTALPLRAYPGNGINDLPIGQATILSCMKILNWTADVFW